MQNFHLSQCFGFFYFKILKETFNAHFQVHQLILGSFWVTTRIHLHASVLKKNTHISSYCAVLQHCIPQYLKRFVLAPVSLRLPPGYPVYSDWSAHTSLTQHH